MLIITLDPASVEDVVEGSTDPKDTQGSTDMAQLTNQALSNCATTKVVLAGYSQGAQQVHGALMNLQPGQASVSPSSLVFASKKLLILAIT